MDSDSEGTLCDFSRFGLVNGISQNDSIYSDDISVNSSDFDSDR